MNLLISCEVGGDHVPSQWIAPSGGRATETATLLETAAARADRPGRYIAEAMASQLGATMIANPHSLQLVDVTRSLHHRQLFSPMTRHWSADDRQQLIDSIYRPYRQRVRARLRTLLNGAGYAIHLSVRTFELRRGDGKIRRTDLGLLYDPAVDDEVDFCIDWVEEMYDEAPMLRVRRNYPRRGTTDSLTKSMRSEFSDRGYIGIELMLNRAWAQRAVALREEAIGGMCRSLRAVVNFACSEAA